MRPDARNLVLLVLVALLAAANLTLVERREEAPAVARLFPDLSPEAARVVVLGAPDGTTVTLRREGRGDPWTLAERADYRAYQPAVEGLLRGLGGATDAEREATSRTSHEALGVGDASGNRIRVEGPDGALLADTVQGVPPEGGRGSRLRPSGQDAVYRTATVPRAAPEAARWIDPDVLAFDVVAAPVFVLQLVDDAGAPRRVRFERLPDGRFRAQPEAEGAGERTLPPALVDPLLRSLDSLVALDVVAGPSEAEGAPAFRLGVEFPAGEPGEDGAAPRSAGGLRLGPLRPEDLPALAAGAVHAWRAGFAPPGPPAGSEVRWFALPRASEARLVALAERLFEAL